MIGATQKTAAIDASRGFDLEAIRRDFPGLDQQVHGRRLVYLDNAATAQKPKAVIEATVHAYRDCCANVHRGVHLLSERATREFDDARRKIATFIHAQPQEIVFTKGATEAINLVAHSFGREFLRPGQEVLLTTMEHHANIVPWQLLAKERGLTIRPVPISDRGELDLEALGRMIGPKTGLIGVVWVSNALGTINPIRQIVELARGIPILVDAAQALPHLEVDVTELGVDFLAASGHKFYGPTGIGFLWAKRERLSSMPPYQGGGDMIASVSFEGTSFREPPARFEAGTPNVAGVIGLGAAVDYLSSLDLDAVRRHEEDLLQYAVARLSEVPDLRLIGTARQRAGSISFTLGEIHPHDIGTILDREGIAIRTGHHCAQPLMERFGLVATARASFGLYNTKEEVELLVDGLKKVREVLG